MARSPGPAELATEGIGTGGVIAGTGGVVAGTGGGGLGTGGRGTGGRRVMGTGGTGTGGAAMLSFDMTSYAGGTVAVGTSRTITLTLTQQRVDELGAAAGPGHDRRRVVQRRGRHLRANSAVPGGGSCTIKVTFQPSSYGNKSGAISLAISPGGTVMATLTGVGQQTFTLTVNKTGSTGTGTVTSIPAGDINCDPRHEVHEHVHRDHLRPVADAARGGGDIVRVHRLGGRYDCATYGTNDCQLTMSANRTATAVFGAQYTVTVSFAGAAAGTVLVQPGNTTCTSPTPCTVTVNSGTAIALTAKPTNSGATVSSVLTGWTGACAGSGPFASAT